MFVLVSSLMPRILNHITRAKGCIIGMMLLIIGIGGMGTVYYIEDATTFVVFSFVWKILLGIGCGFISTSSTATVATHFKDNREYAIGRIQACTALGLMMGPLVGSVLFTIGGYMLPFFVFAAIFLVLYPFISYNLKNLAAIEESEGLIEPIENENDQINFWTCFSSHRFVMALLITFIYNVSFTQYLPTLSLHYLGMGCSQIFIGVSFALPIMVYVIMVLNIHHISARIPKIYMLFMGLAMLSIAFSLIGPAPFLPVEPAPFITTTGLVL